MVKWPFKRLRDLQIWDKQVTLNHLGNIFWESKSSMNHWRAAKFDKVIANRAQKCFRFFWMLEFLTNKVPFWDNIYSFEKLTPRILLGIFRYPQKSYINIHLSLLNKRYWGLKEFNRVATVTLHISASWRPVLPLFCLSFCFKFKLNPSLQNLCCCFFFGVTWKLAKLL